MERCLPPVHPTAMVLKEGEQVVLGANDQYIGLCRRHCMAGDLGPDFNGQGTGD